MKSTLSAKRKGDALITLRQNNNNRLVEVVNMNSAAEKLTGYHLHEIIGKNFEDILPERINESLDDYMEFEDPNHDFASVARRIPNFQIKNKKGNDIPVSLKVFYLASKNSYMPEYEILLKDITLIRKIEELKNKITSDDDVKHITDETGLLKAYNTAYEFVEKNAVEVSFVAFGIDSYKDYVAQYDEPSIIEAVNKFAEIIKDTCRDEDIVAYIDKGIVGVVLLDCNSTSAYNVIERIINKILDKKIKMVDDSEFNTTLSVSYTQLNPEYHPAELFNSCIENTYNIQASGGNAINELS